MSTQSIISVLENTDPRNRRLVAGFVVATLSSAIALSITLLLPGSDTQPTLLLCAAAILLSTWIGSWPAGLLSATLTFLGAAYFLFKPHGSLLIDDKAHLIHVGIASWVFITLALTMERRPTLADFVRWTERMERFLPRRAASTTTRERTPYDLFAEVYGKHFGVETTRRLLPVHHKLILRHLPPGSDVLDLCCGSGQLAAALSGRGFRVTGIDNSHQMLRLARRNAPAATFLLADARFFQLPQVYAGALCTFNSLAHVHRYSDLEAVFRNVNRALAPSGLFLFDLFLEPAYLRRWRGNFSVVEDGQVCVVDASYNPETRFGRNDITVFELERQWRRADITLLQKCHSEDDIFSALKASGFDDVCRFDGENDLNLENEHGRAFFLCRKS